MLVKAWIWVDSGSEGCGTLVNEVLVMFDRGGSESREDIDCRASIVADGGVFSPRIAFGPERVVGRSDGVSLKKSLVDGVGVPTRVGEFSGELIRSFSRLKAGGVPGIRPAGRSGERSGDLVFDPSRKLLRSLTFVDCNDCIRLCAAPFIKDRSGDLGGIGLTVYALAGALSRAFSSRAFAVAAMAADVFGRVVRLGDPGFIGSGGGARSGSELSHLLRRRLISVMFLAESKSR